MAWGLSSWLGLVRCVQALATAAATALQAFLVAHISINRLGLAQNMIVLQFMITACLIFVSLAFTIVHTGNRSRQTVWLVAGIVGDVIFVGIDVAILTLLSQAGVPSNCAGLTRWNYTPEDENRPPKEGYTSIRFTNGYGGAKGELDKFCSLERGYYFIAIALIFAFIITINLSILRICQGSFTKNSKVRRQIVAALHEEEKIKSQTTSPVSPQSEAHTPPLAPHPAPPSEGVLSPRASVRQTQRAQHYNNIGSVSSGANGSSCSSSTALAGPSTPRVTVPHHYHRHQPASPLSPIYPASSSSSSARQPAMNDFGGYATPEEGVAAAALITDGSGHPESMSSGLPPYTPGRLHPMAGHANESNEIRLSDYVKGETRAQNMKDGLR